MPSLIWAFETDNYPFTQAHITSLDYKGKAVSLPKKIGLVQQIFQGQNKLVAVIQDLHCNAEVQSNIAATIQHLAEEHGLHLIGEEGAFETVNVSKLRTFPSAATRKSVSDYFVGQGKLSGAEYYAITGKHPVRIEGIETPALYAASEKLLASFLNNESQGLCCDLHEILESLKGKIYGPGLGRFDRLRTEYGRGKMDLLQYAAQLVRTGREADLSLQAYPCLREFALNDPKFWPEDLGLDALQAEMDRLESAIRERLYTHQDERELDQAFRQADMIERLLNISATPQDLADWRRAPARARLDALAAFLQKWEQTDFAADGLPGLEQALANADRFYALADRRSGHFVANLLRKMDHFGESLSLMIVGGYHTEGVLAELERRNISYVSIRPRLSRQDRANPYFSLLAKKSTPLEKLLARDQNILALRTLCADGPYAPDQVVKTSDLPSGAARVFARTAELLAECVQLADLKTRGYALPQAVQKLLGLLSNYPANEPIGVDCAALANANPAEPDAAREAALVIPTTLASPQGRVRVVALPGAATCGPAAAAFQQMKVAGLQLFFCYPQNLSRLLADLPRQQPAAAQYFRRLWKALHFIAGSSPVTLASKNPPRRLSLAPAAWMVLVLLTAILPFPFENGRQNSAAWEVFSRGRSTEYSFNLRDRLFRIVMDDDLHMSPEMVGVLLQRALEDTGADPAALPDMLVLYILKNTSGNLFHFTRKMDLIGIPDALFEVEEDEVVKKILQQVTLYNHFLRLAARPLTEKDAAVLWEKTARFAMEWMQRYKVQPDDLLHRMRSHQLKSDEFIRALYSEIIRQHQNGRKKIFEDWLSPLAGEFAERIWESLNSPKGCLVALDGPEGVGKSTFARQTAEQFAIKHPGRKLVVVDLDAYRMPPDMQTVMKKYLLHEELQPEEAELLSRMDKPKAVPDQPCLREALYFWDTRAIDQLLSTLAGYMQQGGAMPLTITIPGPEGGRVQIQPGDVVLVAGKYPVDGPWARYYHLRARMEDNEKAVLERDLHREAVQSAADRAKLKLNADFAQQGAWPSWRAYAMNSASLVHYYIHIPARRITDSRQAPAVVTLTELAELPQPNHAGQVKYPLINNGIYRHPLPEFGPELRMQYQRLSGALLQGALQLLPGVTLRFKNTASGNFVSPPPRFLHFDCELEQGGVRHKLGRVTVESQTQKAAFQPADTAACGPEVMAGLKKWMTAAEKHRAYTLDLEFMHYVLTREISPWDRLYVPGSAGLSGEIRSIRREELEHMDLWEVPSTGVTNKIFVVNGHPNLLAKVLRDYAVRMDEDGTRTVSFENDILPGIQVAQKLGDRAVETKVFREIRVKINGQDKTVDLQLQNSVNVTAWITSLVAAGDLDRARELIDQFLQLQKDMWAEGIIDFDFQFANNYGYNPDLRRIQIIDFDHLTDRYNPRWEDIYGEFFVDYYRNLNSAFLAKLSPELGTYYYQRSPTGRDFLAIYLKDRKVGSAWISELTGIGEGIGGIWPWMKHGLKNYLRVAPGVYGSQIAWWLENSLSLAAGGVAAGAWAYLTTGVLAWPLAGPAYMAAWPIFFALHFFGRDEQGRRATPGAIALAGVITAANLALGCLPLSFPIILLLSFLPHLLVNLLAPRIALQMKPAGRILPWLFLANVRTPAGPGRLRDVWPDKVEALSREAYGSLQTRIQDASGLTQEHHERTRQEILAAMEAAPAGKPVLVWGADDLESIPDELFHSQKFPRIILADMNPGLVHRALKKRNLTDLPAGRVQVQKLDMTLMPPELLDEIDRALVASPDSRAAAVKIMQVIRTQEDRHWPLAWPATLQPGSFGLVISANVAPDIANFALLALEKVMAEHFRQPSDYAALTFKVAQPEFQAAVLPFVLSLLSRQSGFQKMAVSADGAVCLVATVAQVDRQALGRTLNLDPAGLVKTFEALGRQLAGLGQTSGPQHLIFQELLRLFKEDPGRAPVFWMDDSILLNSPESVWARGMTILRTAAWKLQLEPDDRFFHLVQSLTYTPRGGLEEVLRLYAAGQQPAADRIYLALQILFKQSNLYIQSETMLRVFQKAVMGLFLLPEEVTEIFKAADLKPGQSLLEVGPGFSILCLVAALSGAHVTVIEKDPEAATYLRTLAAETRDLLDLAGGSFTLIEGDAGQLEIQEPLAGRVFDHVWAVDVLVDEGSFLSQPTVLPEEWPEIDKHLRAAFGLAQWLAQVKTRESGSVYCSILNVLEAPETNLMKNVLAWHGFNITRQNRVATPGVNRRTLAIKKMPAGIKHGWVYRFEESDEDVLLAMMQREARQEGIGPGQPVTVIVLKAARQGFGLLGTTTAALLGTLGLAAAQPAAPETFLVSFWPLAALVAMVILLRRYFRWQAGRGAVPPAGIDVDDSDQLLRWAIREQGLVEKSGQGIGRALEIGEAEPGMGYLNAGAQRKAFLVDTRPRLVAKVYFSEAGDVAGSDFARQRRIAAGARARGLASPVPAPGVHLRLRMPTPEQNRNSRPVYGDITTETYAGPWDLRRVLKDKDKTPEFKLLAIRNSVHKLAILRALDRVPADYMEPGNYGIAEDGSALVIDVGHAEDIGESAFLAWLERRLGLDRQLARLAHGEGPMVENIKDIWKETDPEALKRAVAEGLELARQELQAAKPGPGSRLLGWGGLTTALGLWIPTAGAAGALVAPWHSQLTVWVFGSSVLLGMGLGLACLGWYARQRRSSRSGSAAGPLLKPAASHASEISRVAPNMHILRRSWWLETLPGVRRLLMSSLALRLAGARTAAARNRARAVNVRVWPSVRINSLAIIQDLKRANIPESPALVRGFRPEQFELRLLTPAAGFWNYWLGQAWGHRAVVRSGTDDWQWERLVIYVPESVLAPVLAAAGSKDARPEMELRLLGLMLQQQSSRYFEGLRRSARLRAWTWNLLPAGRWPGWTQYLPAGLLTGLLLRLLPLPEGRPHARPRQRRPFLHQRQPVLGFRNAA